MIDMPSSLENKFKELYGVNPVFIIEIDWSDDTGSTVTNRYSTEEFSSPLTYRYISEFSNIEIASHVEGLGSVNSISVTAIDDFGHFKSRLDDKNVYHKNQIARVYLGEATISQAMLIYTGRLENIKWREENKELTFDIITEPLDITIGFTPNIEMIDSTDPKFKLFNEYLNEKTWPRVYGTVKHFEAIPLVNVSNQIEVQTEVTGVITDGTGSGFDDIDVNDEVANFIDLDTPDDYWIFAKDDILDTTGSFTDIGGGDIVYQPTAITNRLWEPVSPVPTTRVDFNILELDIIPPIPLKGMQIFVRFVFTFGFVQFLVKVLDTGFFEGKFRIRINVLMFGDFVPTIVFAGKNLFTPTAISTDYKIMPKNETIFQRYIVDTKEDTTVTKVQVEDEDGLHVIEPTEYTQKTTTVDGAFWTAATGFDEHPNVTYIEFNPESFFDFYEDFIAGNDVNEGILVDLFSFPRSEKGTLIDIITLAGQTADMIHLDEVINRNVNFVFEDEEDFVDILTDIAWQMGKVPRFHNGDIQIIDIPIGTESIKTIEDDEAILNSLIYHFTPPEDIFTKLRITLQGADFREELIEFTEINNSDKYIEKTLDVDYFVFANRTDAQLTIDFWRDRLSDAYHQITFRATLESLALEVWDTIEINLGNLNFQDENETFLTNVLTGSSATWDGLAVVKDVQLDWERLEVIITARFNARITEIQ